MTDGNQMILLWTLGILQALVSGLAIAIWNDMRAVRSETLSLRIVLTGERGGNGVKGDVASIKRWLDDDAVPGQQRNLLRLQRIEDRLDIHRGDA